MLADKLKQRLQKIRGIPVTMGLRPNAVSVITRTWASGRVGNGTFDDGVPLVLSPTPKVREMSTREIASSGGRYEMGDLVVGPITPSYTGPPAGGYSVDQVAPKVSPDQTGVEVIYLVTGSDAGEYSRISLNSDFALHYTLTIRRSNRTP